MKRFAAGLACLILFGAAAVQAGADSPTRTAYLKFRLAEGHVEWLGAQIVPGKAKTPRHPVPAVGQLQVDLLTRDNQPLLSRLIPDPSRVRYEYVDEDGRLQSHTIVTDSVEFYVRVPYSPALGRAVFRRITGVRATAGGPSPTTEALGTVEVALEATDE
jgi:hypothetical protein